MLRILAFVLALLLLNGNIDPTRGWLIALVVLTGLAAVRPRPWNPFDLRPALDLRLASFTLAVLLLAGTVDANRDWLIALSAVTGLAAVMPRLIALDRRRDDRWMRGEFDCGSMNRTHHRWRWELGDWQ